MDPLFDPFWQVWANNDGHMKGFGPGGLKKGSKKGSKRAKIGVLAPYFGPLFDRPPTGASELLPKTGQKVVLGVHEKGSKTPLFGPFLGSFWTPFLDRFWAICLALTYILGSKVVQKWGQKWTKKVVQNDPFWGSRARFHA